MVRMVVLGSSWLTFPNPTDEVLVKVELRFRVESEFAGIFSGILNVTKPGREKASRKSGQAVRISFLSTFWAPCWQLQKMYWGL